MKYALSMQDIQSIIDNANQQHGCCSEGEVLHAFLYYYVHDAYITFDAT